jgi:hypothetical protein
MTARSALVRLRVRAKASPLSPIDLWGIGTFCTDRAALGDKAFTLRRHATLWACERGLLEGSR